MNIVTSRLALELGAVIAGVTTDGRVVVGKITQESTEGIFIIEGEKFSVSQLRWVG